METTVYNQKGEKVGTFDLPEYMFNVSSGADLVHQALRTQRANAREAIAHTKDRSEVRGGGRKPWRQKGTGRARHGSRRSPLWSGGGVTFGPRSERDYSLKINKKQKQKALFAVLTAKVKEGKFALMDAMTIPAPKTKTIVGVLHAMAKVVPTMETKKTLIVTPSTDKNIMLSARNLPNASVIAASSLNIYDLLAHANVMMLKDSIAVMQQTYTRTAKGSGTVRVAVATKAKKPVRAERKAAAQKASKKTVKKVVKKTVKKAAKKTVKKGKK